MKRYLATREAKMIALGLENVEELKKLEDEEERQKSAVESSLGSAGPSSPNFNFSEADFAAFEMSPSFFLEPVPSDGTAQ